VSTVKLAVYRILRSVPKLWSATIASHRTAVRDAVVDATVELVAERGLRGVTMAEVAARAGIGRATLYKYFDDAEAILRVWHEREVGRHLTDLAAIAEAPDHPANRLAAVLERFALNAQTGRGAHDAELAAVLHRDEQATAARHRLRGVLAGLVGEAAVSGAVRDDIAADELAAYCMAALSAAIELRSAAGARRLVALILAGLQVAVLPTLPDNH
jgi:AcrR family transcriptional regulator